jgi:hypothetical protein
MSPVLSERDAILGEIKEYICNEVLPGLDYVYYSLRIDQFAINGAKDVIDIYGVHIKPIHEIVSIHDSEDIVTKTTEFENGLKIRFISHDVRLELKSLIKGDYTAYERLHSEPFMITERYKRMREISHLTISKEVAISYYNIASARYDKYLKIGKDQVFQKAPPQKFMFIISPLLSGIYLLETGVFESNVSTINKRYNYKPIKDIISGTPIDDAMVNAFIKDLFVTFNSAKDKSKLHEKSSETAIKDANDFIVECRMTSHDNSAVLYGIIKEFVHHEKMGLSSIVVSTGNGLHQLVGSNSSIREDIMKRFRVGDPITVRAFSRFDWEIISNNTAIRPTTEEIKLVDMIHGAQIIREELQKIYHEDEKKEWGIDIVDIKENNGELSPGQG